MCVMSMVMDQYKPYIPDQWPYNPIQPLPQPQPIQDPAQLQEMIDAFHKAVAAAEVYDRLTGQPDCIDPEKAELLKRVAKLEKQLKKEKKMKRPKVRVTLSTFDTGPRPVYRAIREHVKLKDFEEITLDEYQPSGMTPLYDAVFEFVESVRSHATENEVQVGLLLDESGSMAGQREEVISGANEYIDAIRDIKKIDKNAGGKGFLVITTDGYENTSRKHTASEVAKLLGECEKDGWVVVYLGAGIDGWATGNAFGATGSANLQTVSASSTRAGLRSTRGHTQSYLSDSSNYLVAAAAAGTGMRSVTEDGEELLTNINAT